MIILEHIYKCHKCSAIIKDGDTYCYNCGNITTFGIMDYDNNKKVLEDNNKTLVSIISLLVICLIILFPVTSIVKGNICYPFIYAKKQFLKYKYGYNISILTKEKTYHNLYLNKEESKEMIEKEYSKQKWMCNNNIKTLQTIQLIKSDNRILNVNLCDIKEENAQLLLEILKKLNSIFPNTAGVLTNITIENSKSKDDYIAKFNPINSILTTDNIKKYPIVNKTQIILNSYYFLNKDIKNSKLKNSIYVKDATYESIIAHEFGHYISYVALLKQNNIQNLLYIDNSNYESYNNIKKDIEYGIFSKKIVLDLYNNYDINNDVSLEDFVGKISQYARKKDREGNIIYDEVIAEAIHDYYLHGNNSNEISILIVNKLKEMLI